MFCKSHQTVPSVSFLLLSGGVGQRSNHHEPKQFYDLQGHPLLAHSVIPAAEELRIGEIITNAPEGFEDRTKELMEAYCGDTPYKVLPAGETRQESCQILAEAASYETVILHEAARPSVDVDTYAVLLDAPELNAGYCSPIPFSMCSINDVTKQIENGVSRDHVFNIQLPQKFDRQILLQAHAAARDAGRSFNEDAVMVTEMTGYTVQSILGQSRNRKITTPEDFFIAEYILTRMKK